MAFVQIRTYSTSDRAAFDEVEREWLEDTEGVRTVHRRVLLEDRDSPGRYVELMFFDSYEDAMHNSMLPATATISGRAAALTADGFEFQNLHVRRDELL